MTEGQNVRQQIAVSHMAKCPLASSGYDPVRDDPTPAELDAAERMLLGWGVVSPRERPREVARQVLVAARVFDPLRHPDAPTIGVGR